MQQTLLLPLDATTHVGGWWTDDDQITWLLVNKRFANPGEGKVLPTT